MPWNHRGEPLCCQEIDGCLLQSFGAPSLSGLGNSMGANPHLLLLIVVAELFFFRLCVCLLWMLLLLLPCLLGLFTKTQQLISRCIVKVHWNWSLPRIWWDLFTLGHPTLLMFLAHMHNFPSRAVQLVIRSEQLHSQVMFVFHVGKPMLWDMICLFAYNWPTLLHPGQNSNLISLVTTGCDNEDFV